MEKRNKEMGDKKEDKDSRKQRQRWEIEGKKCKIDAYLFLSIRY